MLSNLINGGFDLRGPFFSGGGGGGGGGGGDGGTPVHDCLAIFVTTTLNSAVREVISTLHVGDLLEIRLRENSRTLIAQTEAGAIAGSITSDEITRLIRCIAEGYRYRARVVELAGGRCRVEIRPVR